MAWIFGIAFTLDVIALLAAIYTLVSNRLKYGDYSKNGPLGFITLIACGWVGGSYGLYRYGFKFAAAILAWIPAFPLVAYGLFILLFIVLKPDMK